MIYAELKNYLVKIASPETVDGFDEAIAILEKYEVPDYMSVFEAVVGENSIHADADILDVLQVNMKVMLNYLLSMQGVTLSEDVTPSQTNTLVNGLFNLAQYEDKETIRAILDSDSDALEMFCELMSLITEFSTDECMALVQEVSPSFVPNLKDTLEGQQENSVQTAEEVKLQIKTFISLKKYLVNAPTFADRYFQQLGSIGLPLNIYFQLYRDTNLDYTAMSATTIAHDLLGLACLSSDGVGTPALAVRGLLSTLFSDINTATKVDIEVFGQSVKWEAFNAQA